jgi:hypothetical protein
MKKKRKLSENTLESRKVRKQLSTDKTGKRKKNEFIVRRDKPSGDLKFSLLIKLESIISDNSSHYYFCHCLQKLKGLSIMTYICIIIEQHIDNMNPLWSLKKHHVSQEVDTTNIFKIYGMSYRRF